MAQRTQPEVGSCHRWENWLPRLSGYGPAAPQSGELPVTERVQAEAERDEAAMHRLPAPGGGWIMRRTVGGKEPTLGLHFLEANSASAPRIGSVGTYPSRFLSPLLL